jgi:uncharacterized protein YdaU (DUF1376 family)
MFSYQHHIGDFRRDTASLSDVVAMAYLKLLWMYYDTELPLPADAKLLAFKIGSDAETVQLLLDSFFQLDENVYRHKRCDAEIIEYYSRSEKARDKANQRWKNAKASNNHATALLEHSHSIATAKKSHANREPITDNQIYISSFDTFWKQYPRKIAKDNARKAWLKIKPDEDLVQKILTAVKTHKTFKVDEQFIPHAASWLNAKRWDDDVADKQSSSGLPTWAKTAFEAKKIGG